MKTARRKNIPPTHRDWKSATQTQDLAQFASSSIESFSIHQSAVLLLGQSCLVRLAGMPDLDERNNFKFFWLYNSRISRFQKRTTLFIKSERETPRASFKQNWKLIFYFREIYLMSQIFLYMPQAHFFSFEFTRVWLEKFLSGLTRWSSVWGFIKVQQNFKFKRDEQLKTNQTKLSWESSNDHLMLEHFCRKQGTLHENYFLIVPRVHGPIFFQLGRWLMALWLI